MTANQQFWLAIIGALMTGLFAPWFVRYLGKRTEDANNDVLFVNASRLTVSTVMDVLKEQRELNKEFTEKIETLEAALGMKNEYIEALEREIKLMKEYLKRLIVHLRTLEIDFPPPPEGLLDTDPKIKRRKNDGTGSH